MTNRRFPWLVVLALVCVGTLQAATLDQALVQADGRKRAAVSGVRDIKAKSPNEVDAARGPYTEAATRHNTWVESLIRAVQEGDSMPPAATVEAESAASALVSWVSVRNRALGVPELSPSMAESVKRSVVQNLGEIAETARNNNRRADEKRRTGIASTLKQRLSWPAWDEAK